MPLSVDATAGKWNYSSTGAVQATVLFSGMAPGYVGLWQIDAQTPQTVTPGNAVPPLDRLGTGGATGNTVTVAAQ